MNIGQFCNHIALNGCVRAHHFDFIFQIAILIPLNMLDKLIKRPENGAKSIGIEPRFHRMRIGRTIAPAGTGLHPPRLSPIGIQHGLWVGQSPYAEFGNNKRFVTLAFSIAKGRKGPVGTVGKFLREFVPFSPTFWH